MGYVEKETLMEKLSQEGGFSEEELSFVNNNIIDEKIDRDTILDINVINAFEKNGILERFHAFCKKHNYFPQWLENVVEGNDVI